MNEWEEISFNEVEEKGVFKFTYLFDGEYLDDEPNCNPFCECIENDEDDDIFAEDLLVKLKNNKRVSQLKAYKSIAEYE